MLVFFNLAYRVSINEKRGIALFKRSPIFSSFCRLDLTLCVKQREIVKLEISNHSDCKTLTVLQKSRTSIKGVVYLDIPEVI